MAVYDMTSNATYPATGERGFAIHDAPEDGMDYFEIYTDDGRGNGDYICRTTDKWWADRIASALDATTDK